MTFGDRLKEERERMGMTQPVFADLAGTTKKSQIDYEKNVAQPKAAYLTAIAVAGADVQYILTGVRSGNIGQVAAEDDPSMANTLDDLIRNKHVALLEALRYAIENMEKN